MKIINYIMLGFLTLAPITMQATQSTIFELEYNIKNMNHHLSAATGYIIDDYLDRVILQDDQDYEQLYAEMIFLLKKLAKEGPWERHIDHFVKKIKKMNIHIEEGFLVNVRYHISIADAYYESIQEMDKK